MITYTNVKDYPFQIAHNPFNKEDKIPPYIKSLAFADEYEAMLVLAMWLNYSKKTENPSYNDFSKTVPCVFRILKLENSKWSE